jgi:6,7-dimethyl-8-ribityllumazine synthase
MENFAIALSEFNSIITSKLLSEALKEAKIQNIRKPAVFKVPGALELPFIAQSISKMKKYNAIILLGCVIKGNTDHYEYVCMQMSQGLQYVMLKNKTPIIFGIITADNIKQALDRINGLKGNKGQEALKAAIKVCKVENSIIV